jgi:hypothetical protein
VFVSGCQHCWSCWFEEEGVEAERVMRVDSLLGVDCLAVVPS